MRFDWSASTTPEQTQAIKNTITADALRLITGHTQAFRPLHRPMPLDAQGAKALLSAADGVANVRIAAQGAAGHTTWRCDCDIVVYGPPRSRGCSLLHGHGFRLRVVVRVSGHLSEGFRPLRERELIPEFNASRRTVAQLVLPTITPVGKRKERTGPRPLKLIAVN